VVDKGSVHKGWVVAWRGSAKDVRDSGLVAYVEDGHDALKDLLGFGERERICRGERVRRHAIGIGDGVEGRRAARPGVEMADDAVGLSGRVQHDCAEAVVGDVADERGEDLVVGDVGALTGGLVEAEATEPVEFEVGCEVLGVAVPREEVQHWRAARGRRKAALDELAHCGACGVGNGSPRSASAAARRRRLAARMEGG